MGIKDKQKYHVIWLSEDNKSIILHGFRKKNKSIMLHVHMFASKTAA